MKITRLAGALGAEITDFDLKTVQTQKDAEILKRLLTECLNIHVFKYYSCNEIG